MANQETIKIAGKNCPVFSKSAQVANMSALDQVTQQSGALASNPATGQALGLQNMQLSGGSTTSDGMPKADMLKLLDRIGSSAPTQAIDHKGELESAITQVQDPNWQKKLTALLNAIQFNTSIRQQQTNPATGEKDPTAPQIAQNLAKELRPTVNQEKQASIASLLKTAAEKEAPKKKKRGNPFRVLMGRVGKLLDHGVEKHDIIRQIHKQMDFFNEETISKAVDIVKDYNRKDTLHDEIAEDHSAELEDKQDMSNPFSRQPMQVSPMYSPIQPIFASTRSAQAVGQSQAEPQKRPQASDTIYDAKPDWEKRSTAELMSRLNTLTNTPKEGVGRDSGKVVSIPKATSEAKAILAALKSRGFDPKEVEEYLERTDRLPIKKDK